MPDASLQAAPTAFRRKNGRSLCLPPMRVGIALGSNLGDRLDFLRAARQRLTSLHDHAAPFLCSKVYETRPIGCPENSPPFLNAAIELSSTTPPIDILQKLLAIESELGRPNDHSHHAPRTLDLDLLYCDNLTLSLNSLTLPHQRISQRLFVLMPLCDICPERILPGHSENIRVLRDALIFSSNSKDISLFALNFYPDI